jgi:5-methylcytosine-specific restriction endonuclease McrA
MDYNSKRWQRLREKILKRDNYMCQYSKRYGRRVPANMVHHIYPAEVFPEYQWCEWNLISLSNEAHNMMHDRDSHQLTDIGISLQKKINRQGYPPAGK